MWKLEIQKGFGLYVKGATYSFTDKAFVDRLVREGYATYASPSEPEAPEVEAEADDDEELQALREAVRLKGVRGWQLMKRERLLEELAEE